MQKGRGFVWIVLLLAALSAQAQQEGIRFTGSSWDTILAEAGRQHRIIFIDVYTDWCRPCKLMDEEVFSQKAAGVFFNTYFINFRLNAEKGEGIKLAAKYEVPSYPFYLFVDSDGKLVYEDHGFCNGNQLVAIGQAALNKNKATAK